MGRRYCVAAFGVLIALSACARLETSAPGEGSVEDEVNPPSDAGARAKKDARSSPDGGGDGAVALAGCRMEAEPNDELAGMLLSGATCGTLTGEDDEWYVRVDGATAQSYMIVVTAIP